MWFIRIEVKDKRKEKKVRNRKIYSRWRSPSNGIENMFTQTVKQRYFVILLPKREYSVAGASNFSHGNMRERERERERTV